MLLWKTQVMNFITWALNSDSMAALFKSSQQGTVWKFTCSVRNTGSYKIQTKIRCVRKKRMKKVYLCVWVSHVSMHLNTAWTAEWHTPKPEHVCSHPSSHDSFHVTSTHAGTGISTPRELPGTLAGLGSWWRPFLMPSRWRPAPYPLILATAWWKKGLNIRGCPFSAPDSLLPLPSVSHCLQYIFPPLVEAMGMEWVL